MPIARAQSLAARKRIIWTEFFFFFSFVAETLLRNILIVGRRRDRHVEGCSSHVFVVVRFGSGKFVPKPLNPFVS